MTTDQLRSKIRRITKTTVNDYSDLDLISDLVSEMRAIQTMIRRDRGVLEFDDKNYINLPIATFPIVAGQTAYKITEDQDGNLIETKHKVAIDIGDGFKDVPRKTMTEGQQDALLDSGTQAIPDCYYEVGTSIVFAQKPAQSGTGMVWFDRDVDIILTTDTTKVPGIPVAYANLLAYRTSLNYDDMPDARYAKIERKILQEQERLAQYESNRRADEATIMSPSVISGI